MRQWSIARRVFLGQFAVILAFTMLVAGALAVVDRKRVVEEAQARMTTLAETVATSPAVISALSQISSGTLAREHADLQPFAERVMELAPADFVTIMTLDRIRLTHRDPGRIGEEFLGNTDRAILGFPQTETFTGTLGPSVRAVVPVFSGKRVVGMVSAGTKTQTLEATTWSRLAVTGALSGLLLLIGILATALIQRYLRRVTHGWGPEELGRVFAFYDAALRSGREAMLLTDPGGRILLYNDEASRLLGLPSPDTERSPLSIRALPEELTELIGSARRVRESIIFTEDRVLLATQHPALEQQETPAPWLGSEPWDAEEAIPFHSAAPRSLGLITILRDHTELQRLGGELAGAHALAAALRSQSHEYANRLHTLITLVETGHIEEVIDMAGADLRSGQILADNLLDPETDPALSALLMGKAGEAFERGIALEFTFEGAEGWFLSALDTVSILGNLIDNALDAVASRPHPGTADARWVDVEISVRENLIISVLDSGPGVRGVSLSDLVQRGFSTKPETAAGRGIGLTLVARSVARLRGTLRVEDSEVTGAGARFIVEIPLPERRK